jgi:hypothetical protein
MTLCDFGRCVPVVAVLGAGYGVSNYLGIQYQRRSQVLQEEERLRKNALLMDAYGDKTSLEDVERALDLYHQVSFPLSAVHWAFLQSRAD